MENNLKIVALKAENVKGLKAIEIRPDENLQVISGKNGAGKSSVMDSIWMALGGREALDKTERPVRNGADEAIIEIDLGEMRAIRRFKADGKTTIEVRSKAGVKLNSPQKLLDALIGKLSFDPFSFSNLRPQEQKKTLLDIIGVDPTPYEERKEKVFQERTLVNREVEILKGQLAGLMEYRADGEIEPEISAADIVKKLREAQEIKRQNDEKRREVHNLRRQFDDVNKEVYRLEEMLADIQQKLDEAKKDREEILQKGKALTAEVDELIDPDFSLIQDDMENVEELNAEIRKKNEYRKVDQNLKAKEKESADLTAAIAGIEKEKAEALAGVKFPIDGLGFSAEGVTYQKPGHDPVPFGDVNEGDRLKVSVAIAMALNPKLRIIRIKEGSLLDKTNMEVIREMAKENDYQVWVEMVADDPEGAVGIYIEEGEVKK